VLEFATIEGARCANLDDRIGTLTPGKEADIVLLRADRLDVWPLNNAPMAVVNMMNPSHIETVFIGGKVNKWRGNLVDVRRAKWLPPSDTDPNRVRLRPPGRRTWRAGVGSGFAPRIRRASSVHQAR
jgi:adenine deaminase